VFVLWRQNRTDGVVAVSVFVLALLAKPDYALLIGVMMSLMLPGRLCTRASKPAIRA
jgi:SulP family sulfate permease